MVNLSDGRRSPLPAHETVLLASGPLDGDLLPADTAVWLRTGDGGPEAETAITRRGRTAARRRTDRSTPPEGIPMDAPPHADRPPAELAVPPHRQRRRWLGAAASPSWPPPRTGRARPAAGLSPFDIAGRGATVPFIEHEAEEAAHNGTKIGPTRYYGQLPSEASGREAVTLDAVGEYVEFTLTAPANAVTFRYSLPDSPQRHRPGRHASTCGPTATLLKTVPVTSKYGWYYGGYPFNNNPGDTNPHHFYDEARTMFGSHLAGRHEDPAPGQLDRAVADASPSTWPTSRPVGAPIGKPANAIDVVADFGADPTRRHRLHGRSSRRRSTPARRRAGRSRSRRAPTPSATTSSSTG